MSYANAAAAYKQNSVLTASPEKLVKLLYEGAIRHLERGRMQLAEPSTRRGPEAGDSLGKALSIVSELRTALDPEVGGEIAQNLDRLYDFVQEQITQANLSREPQPLEGGLRVMRTLKEGWDAVIPG